MVGILIAGYDAKLAHLGVSFHNRKGTRHDVFTSIPAILVLLLICLIHLPWITNKEMAALSDEKRILNVYLAQIRDLWKTSNEHKIRS